ncbi:MAG TPA: hypothetical protein VK404_01305, partial [Spirosoma sp.]|nr:hypothetical protein [Spirosoma sp.]
MKHYLPILFLFGSLITRGQSAQPDSVTLPRQPVMIVGGNLIDVETGKVRENVSVLIENEIIRKI